jgi:outer membrane protein
MITASLLLVLASAESPTPARVLTLDDALAIAAEHQPQLAQAHANVRASRARADAAFAPMLPQLATTASYARETANTATKPGQQTSFTITGLPAGIKAPTISLSTPKPTNDSYDAYSTGATASLLVFDFGRSFTTWSAANASADARGFDETTTAEDVAFGVRTNFFGARAQEALLAVAREALANEERHLVEVQAYVDVGRRPQIDLAQVRGERANALVQLVDAENAYAVARARLFQSMGVRNDDRVTLADDSFRAVDGEDAHVDVLVDEARSARADLKSLEKQMRAQELALASTMASFAPVLSVGANINDAGSAIDSLTWNWAAQATLTWTFFSGGSTLAAQREADANLDGLRAAVEAIRQQLVFDVENAQLSVRAAKAASSASVDAVTAAQERFRLAEGRYEEGQGSVIELSDAQLALSNAQAQHVKAEFDLAAARAALLKALGR